AGVSEDAVAVAPIALPSPPLATLVEGDRIAHHVRRTPAVVTVGKVERLPRVPELDVIPVGDPAPGSERDAVGIEDHTARFGRSAVVGPELLPAPLAFEGQRRQVLRR